MEVSDNLMFKRPTHDTISDIIESNLDYLVRFAYFRLGNRTEAEDIVHDAILRFLERNVNDISPDRLRPYLFRIVYNLCLDRMRSVKKELMLDGGHEIEDKAEDVADKEEADRINVCLDTLPQHESEIIRMRVVDSLSFVDISKILSIPQSTVKSRFKTGMDKLRKLFINHRDICD